MKRMNNYKVDIALLWMEIFQKVGKLAVVCCGMVYGL
jgi:hypothetical protein